VSEDLHSPTTAAPIPGASQAGGGSSDRPTFSNPASTGTPAPGERPEVLAGAAFAGGFLAAMILKRLGR
jgi:hypothetical protein